MNEDLLQNVLEYQVEGKCNEMITSLSVVEARLVEMAEYINGVYHGEDIERPIGSILQETIHAYQTKQVKKENIGTTLPTMLPSTSSSYYASSSFLPSFKIPIAPSKGKLKKIQPLHQTAPKLGRGYGKKWDNEELVVFHTLLNIFNPYTSYAGKALRI